MSAMEIAFDKMKDLNEEQIFTLIVYIDKLREENRKSEKPTVKSLRGVLHEFAKPVTEEGAWEKDIAERIASGDESF